MFTKCPSCHTEISFDPPKNAPAGYKHRLKCPNPNCGVTISVVIPSKQPVEQTSNASASSQQQYTNHAVGGVAPQQQFPPQYAPYPPQYPPYQYAPYNGYAPQPYPAPYPYPQAQQPAQSEEAKEPEKTGRWSGSLPKSIIMLVLSLAFVLFHIIGYLVNSGTITSVAGASFKYFNGISYLASLISNGASTLSGVSWLVTFVSFLSMVSFFIAGISLIMNLFLAITCGYGKGAGLTNLIFAALLFIAAILLALGEFLDDLMSVSKAFTFAQYVKTLATTERLSLLLGVVLGVIDLALSLVFFFLKAKPLPKREKKEKVPKEKKEKVKEPKPKKEKKAKKNDKGNEQTETAEQTDVPLN